jgi:hypothetical protein
MRVSLLGPAEVFAGATQRPFSSLRRKVLLAVVALSPRRGRDHRSARPWPRGAAERWRRVAGIAWLDQRQRAGGVNR